MRVDGPRYNEKSRRRFLITSSTYEAVVIGGGVTGAAAAYFLSRAGASTALIERSDLNTEASGRNAGSLHGQIQYPPFAELGDSWARTFKPALALMRESVTLWQSLEAELETDLEVRIGGGLLVADSADQMRLIERKATIEQESGTRSYVLCRSDLHKIAPYLSEHMMGGLLCETEGKANPLLAGPALARSAQQSGAEVLMRTNVLAIERDRGRFTVLTDSGPLTAMRVIDCGGADAGRVSQLVGIPLPVESWPIQAAVTEPVAPLVPHLVYFAREPLTLKQAKAGTLLIGGGWPSRYDPNGRLKVDVGSLRQNLRVAIAVVPNIRTAHIVRSWPGVCPGLPDQLPLLGELPGVRGFYVAMFPFLGFTCGPLLGKLVSQLALTGQTDFDLSSFAPGRLLT